MFKEVCHLHRFGSFENSENENLDFFFLLRLIQLNMVYNLHFIVFKQK